MSFALLQAIKRQYGDLVAPESTGKQESEQRTVAFAREPVSVWGLPQRMKQLDLMARNIADLYLHEHIRGAEALPLPQQVNFGPALDLLLQEIVRITP
jgi:hypothetical protein